MIYNKLKVLQVQNIIIIPKSGELFNLKQFSSKWLNDTGIIPISDLSGDSIFAQNIVQAISLSNKITILFLPTQIQISPIIESDKSFVSEIFKLIVENIDNSTFGGLGVNFHWSIESNEVSMHEISRTHFRHIDNKITDFLSDDSSVYGIYISKDVGMNVRLKLDIKPAKLNISNNECLIFTFNFHSDLDSNESKSDAIKIVNNVDEWYKISREVLDLL